MEGSDSEDEKLKEIYRVNKKKSRKGPKYMAQDTVFLTVVNNQFHTS